MDSLYDVHLSRHRVSQGETRALRGASSHDQSTGGTAGGTTGGTSRDGSGGVSGGAGGVHRPAGGGRAGGGVHRPGGVRAGAPLRGEGGLFRSREFLCASFWEGKGLGVVRSAFQMSTFFLSLFGGLKVPRHD